MSARAAYAQAAERIGDAMRDLERPVSEARDLGQADEVAPPQSNFTKEGLHAGRRKGQGLHPRR